MSATEFLLPSFAKINLHLRVLGKRSDGYHELCTVFQTVSLCDQLTFRRSDTISLTCSDRRLPVDGRNLVVKAAELLRARYEVNAGAKVHLHKRIPSSGGLGGGSSNAAVTLIGLSRLWNIPVTRDDLDELGAALGSDVPFFFLGGTALGTGRGEKVEPMADVLENCMLIVTPGVRVSTREAFERLQAPGLTNEDPNRILQICRLEAESRDFRHSGAINDFEESVFGLSPEIERVRDTLLANGAVTAMLSGSGASVFAIFDKKETRQATLKALEIEPSWRKFAVAAISRSKYREALEIAY
jgi:4-diphosphocytidyl-2-C-methyl-D-erythritol kinase